MSTKVIYFLLSNELAVTDIVSDRIYPGTVPQDISGDYIVFKKINTRPTDSKQHISGLDENRWQVDGYCRFDDDRDQLEIAIRNALDYKKGMINGVQVNQIRFLNSNGNFDDDGEKFRTSQDFNERQQR